MGLKTELGSDQRRALLASPAGWVACGFGSGLVPMAQGTAGSLAALVPWLILRHLSVPLYALAMLAAFALGVWACGVAGRIISEPDHRALVWDEFVGQWIALVPLLLPGFVPGDNGGLAWSMFAAFALFRLFDVWKPWPIDRLDRRVKGGLGVMIDDVLAGVFAAAVLAAALHLMS
ncbi:MAG: phosphatidylglycerophosphatase A [Rhodanobacter sp.]